MLSFLRDGFYKDYLVLLLVTVLMGAAFSSGIAWAVDQHFGDTIKAMIGDYGEYDAILHIREEAQEAAQRELTRIVEEQIQGARIHQTLTIAGQKNFFLAIPEEYKNKASLESLPGILKGVPGLNGYTLIMEPSILVRGVHPSVRSSLEEQIMSIPGVHVVFRDGVNLMVLLSSMEKARDVVEGIQEVLKHYSILELRFPMGFEVDTRKVAEVVMDLLESKLAIKNARDVTSAEYGEELDAFLKTLIEMRSFLLSYASKVRLDLLPHKHLVVGEQVLLQGMSNKVPEKGQEKAPDHVLVEISSVHKEEAEAIIIEGSVSQSEGSLRQEGYHVNSQGIIGEVLGTVVVENEQYRLTYAITESLRLLKELEELAKHAELAVENADTLLTTFQEALMQIEILQIQIRQLYAEMNQGGKESLGEQLVFSLLFSGLLKNLLQSTATLSEERSALESLEHLDVEAMRQSLYDISVQIHSLKTIDVQAIIQEIEHLRDSLPKLEDEEIGKSVRLINTYLAGQVIPGERVQILVTGIPWDGKKLEPIVRETLDNPYVNLYSVSVGMVNPDVRSELFRLLKEIRATIAGLLAVIFVSITLVFDHAPVFSTQKYVRASAKTSWQPFFRRFHLLSLQGALLGSMLLLMVYSLSGATIPFITLKMVGILGACLGLFTVCFAERFSPVISSEIMAGQALGLTNYQILQEIVIPASKPGLLNTLNRLKQRF